METRATRSPCWGALERGQGPGPEVARLRATRPASTQGRCEHRPEGCAKSLVLAHRWPPPPAAPLRAAGPGGTGPWPEERADWRASHPSTAPAEDEPSGTLGFPTGSRKSRGGLLRSLGLSFLGRHVRITSGQPQPPCSRLL